MKLSERSAIGGVGDAGMAPVALAIAALRDAGRPLVDLGEGNPTRVGLRSIEGAAAALADPRADRYAPEALGLAAAREAVAGYYADLGVAVDPGRIVLAASTSELYGWLFKVLCEPGDEVLVPRPSYPLLDWLAALEGVSLATYPTRRDEGHRLDPHEVDRHLGERTRAVLVVHPNNPTGRYVREDDAAALASVARARDVALIVDEVFVDWAAPEADPRRRRTFAGDDVALTLTLSGLSKVCCLPQLKLAWLVVGGQEREARALVERLELIADSYLSVATPVQVALPALLASREAVHAELGARLRANLAALDRAIAAAGAEAPVRRMRLEGGWYAVLEVPRTRSDEAWVIALAEDEGVIVQPGYFFDAEEGLLVVSLLPEEATFEPAIRRVVARLAAG